MSPHSHAGHRKHKTHTISGRHSLFWQSPCFSLSLLSGLCPFVENTSCDLCLDVEMLKQERFAEISYLIPACPAVGKVQFLEKLQLVFSLKLSVEIQVVHSFGVSSKHGRLSWPS